MHRRGEEKMRIYKVKVNGKTYEVKILSVTETEPLEIKTEKVAAAPSAPKATEVAPSTPSVNAKGTEIKAPMQGTVLEIKVKVGDSVKKGDTLLILEAMKLENEIKAPNDGKVLQVVASKGQTANMNDVLVVLG